MRAETELYAVNLFAPHPLPVDPAAYAAYRELIGAEAERYAVELPAEPVEDDDAWQDKVDVLLEHPAPVVSFTFGLPPTASLTALRRAGSLLVQTVTSADEARLAADAGVDALAVQGSSAGASANDFSGLPRAWLGESCATARARGLGEDATPLPGTLSRSRSVHNTLLSSHRSSSYAEKAQHGTPLELT